MQQKSTLATTRLRFTWLVIRLWQWNYNSDLLRRESSRKVSSHGDTLQEETSAGASRSGGLRSRLANMCSTSLSNNFGFISAVELIIAYSKSSSVENVGTL